MFGHNPDKHFKPTAWWWRADHLGLVMYVEVFESTMSSPESQSNQESWPSFNWATTLDHQQTIIPNKAANQQQSDQIKVKRSS